MVVMVYNIINVFNGTELCIFFGEILMNIWLITVMRDFDILLKLQIN